MKGCVQWNSIYGSKNLLQQELTWTFGFLYQGYTLMATRAPVNIERKSHIPKFWGK